MKKLQIKSQFALTQDEVSFLKELPKSLPTTKLSTTDTKKIWGIFYYKFGSFPHVMELAQKNKWTTGERKKIHEAQQDALGELYAASIYVPAIEDVSSFLLNQLGSKNSLQLYIHSLILEQVDDDAPDMRSQRTISVILNGIEFRPKDGAIADFGDIVGIAKFDKDAKCTISYRYPSGLSGSLVEGEQLLLRDWLVINCAVSTPVHNDAFPEKNTSADEAKPAIVTDASHSA